MSADPTSRLIDGLARDLRPVRRLAPLWLFAGALAGLWAGVALLALLPGGPRQDLGVLLAGSPLFGGVLLGLVLAALGGSLAALACAVPGVDAGARGGGALALAGLALAVGSCAAAFAASQVAPSWPGAAEGACFAKGALLGLAPAAVPVFAAWRGWVTRPLRAAALALVGGSAVGAAIVHLGCRAPLSPEHLLLGHVAVPLAVGLAGALPLATALRRWAR